MKKKCILFVSVITFLNFGCVNFTCYNPTGVSDIPTAVPIPDIKARGGEVDWGLSLSGGGIRSGTFGIGVMKALYDDKLLDEIDVISTVSGGGYGLYWLIANNDLNTRFGESVFADQAWVTSSGRLQHNAEFVPNPSILKVAPYSPSRAIELYEDSLVKFANSPDRDPLNPIFPRTDLDETIWKYKTHVRQEKNGAPYFILNTTVCTPHSGSDKWIEITPDYIGNSKFGYHRWSSPGESLKTAQAVAISGAAVRQKLAQKVPDYLHDQNEMTLYDGGGAGDKGENLGAYALIRRGIRNVIIVDGEMDPKYGFGAYKKLRDQLLAEGVTMNVDDIERHLGVPWYARKPFGSPVSRGTAIGCFDDGTVVKTDIYYVKMSKPSGLLREVRSDRGKRSYELIGKEKIDNTRYNRWIEQFHPLEKNRRLQTVPESVTRLEGFVSKHGSLNEDFYKEVVRGYASSLDFDFNPRIAIQKNMGVFAYRFPHMTTADQSYYTDQLHSLIGLGYIQGKATTREIKITPR